MFPFSFFPLTFLVNVGFSLLVGYLASKRGRSSVNWFLLSFFGGLFFSGIIILIILLILPDLNAQARLAHESAWRRRHHDEFDQERSVNKKFRSHVIKRLDRQDEALGLDPVEERPLETALPPKEIVTYPMLGNGTWYLVINGQEQGPMLEGKVLEMLEQGQIGGETYAWSEGMQDWQRAKTIGNFHSLC